MLSAEYKYDPTIRRAKIVLYDEGNVIAELTVRDASKLIAELNGSVNDAFYDFTASTPNFASSKHWLKEK